MNIHWTAEIKKQSAWHATYRKSGLMSTLWLLVTDLRTSDRQKETSNQRPETSNQCFLAFKNEDGYYNPYIPESESSGGVYPHKR